MRALRPLIVVTATAAALLPAPAQAAFPVVRLEVTGRTWGGSGFPGPMFEVTATAYFKRAGSTISNPCRTGDVWLTLHGPKTNAVTQHTRVAVDLTGEVRIELKVDYSRRDFPQTVEVVAEAWCTALSTGNRRETYRVEVPPFGVATTPATQVVPTDQVPTGSLSSSVRENIDAAGWHAAAIAVLTCGAAVAGTIATEGVAGPFLADACLSALIATGAAGTILAIDPPDERVHALTDAAFPRRRFTPSNRVCGRLRGDLCRAYRRWAAIGHERAWLYRAAAMSTNRWHTARATLAGAQRDRAMLLQLTAMNVYAARAAALVGAQRTQGRALATRLRRRGLDGDISPAARRRALKALRDGRAVPRAVRRSLTADHIDWRASIRYMARGVKARDLPASLPEAVASVPRVTAGATRPDPDHLFPGGVADALAAWGVGGALGAACGEHYTNLLSAARRGLPRSAKRYADVLAADLAAVRIERPCVVTPEVVMVWEPFDDTIERGAWRQVVPAPGNSLLGAQDVAVAPSGDLVVVEQFAPAVRRYGPDGSARTALAGPFVAPLAAAVDAAGRTYVVDNGGVHRFDSAGFLERSWTVADPTAIAIGAAGEVFVVSGQSIRSFTPDGELTGTLATPPLVTPRGIAVAGDGRIAIADPGQGAAFVLDRAGNRLATVSLGNPVDVAFDGGARLWIADPGANRVVRTAADLTAVERSITALGPHPLVYFRPQALTFGAGSLLVLDSISQRLFALPSGS